LRGGRFVDDDDSFTPFDVGNGGASCVPVDLSSLVIFLDLLGHVFEDDVVVDE
jgi:hypothetical protein